jgi:1-deoxy-D-xylulose-5-phosphate reductoisomerase
MKTVVILGSTGSVGQNTLAVIEEHRDAFEVAGLSACDNWKTLAHQAKAFAPKGVAIVHGERYHALQSALEGLETVIYTGEEGPPALLADTEPDIVVCAVSGAAGLPLTLASINHCRRLALANKESLVMAGPIVLDLARDRDVEIIPVDSEHSAIFQAMAGNPPESIESIYITASGGALASLKREQLAAVTVEQALNHPTWQMGRKITVDSATLMNKAFEVIEARWLFNLPPDRIHILIHPESIVHSMVEFRDGSIIAQLALPDMRLPIQYALSYPDRLDSRLKRCNLAGLGKLTFCEPDRERFPLLDLGYRAAAEGGVAGAALNAANEVAVDRFLAGDLRFDRIERLVADVFNARRAVQEPDLEAILRADLEARREAEEWS